MAKSTKTDTQTTKLPKCPITRAFFREHAPAGLKVQVGESTILATVKEFESGSLGWYAGDKITLEIGGELVKVQVGLNLTLVGSKELPK